MLKIHTKKPEIFKPKVEVACCWISNQGKVLMLRKTSVWPGKWVLPGGKLETGESPLEAVVREVREETTILLDDPSLAKTFYIENPSYGPYVLHCFKQQLAMQPEAIIDEEHDMWGWFSRDEYSKLDLIPGQTTILEHLS